MNEKIFIQKNKEEKEITGLVGLAVKDFEKNEDLLLDYIKIVIGERGGELLAQDAIKKSFLLYIKDRYLGEEKKEELAEIVEIGLNEERENLGKKFMGKYLKACAQLTKSGEAFKENDFSGYGKSRNPLRIKLKKDHAHLASGGYKEDNKDII